jgi:hypothetical protein
MGKKYEQKNTQRQYHRNNLVVDYKSTGVSGYVASVCSVDTFVLKHIFFDR